MPPEGYNPYDIEEVLGQTLGEFVFSFTTDNNVDYLAIFNRAEHLFNEQCNFAFNIYEFSFLKGASEERVNDIRIKDTIHKLLEYFMAQNGHSIFFICDEVDGRSAARNRLFKKWISYFDVTNYQTFFTQYELPDYQPYVGIISLQEDIGFDEYIKYLELL